MVKWTPEQLQAIETRGKNLLVSAGAGAGKTAVLVERVIRMITDHAHPVDLDRILIVTFTNAAAEEMRVRIGNALRAAPKTHPDSELLNRQAVLLEQATITTLHSFCLDVVRRYFDLIDLDPGFRVGDEHELSLLRQDVLTELFEAQYSSPEAVVGFSRLVEAYGGERGDLALQELVLRLYDFARSTPCPQSWFTKALESCNVEGVKTVDDLPWAGDLRSAIIRELNGARTWMRRAVRISRMPDGPAVYMAVLESELEYVESLIRAARTSWPNLARAFENLGFARMPSCRGGNETLREEVKNLRDKVKDRLQGLARKYFSQQPDDWLRGMREAYPLLRDLVRLATAFDQAYTSAKRQRGLVDFTDLEQLCLRILTGEPEQNGVPSAIAVELRNRYQEIMVDEYQDINGVQESILKMISRQDEQCSNLFMVGDVKQSIYRFRLAEPDLFLQKYHSYPSISDSGRAARVDLSLNFRSRRAIIDAVNRVFSRIMCLDTGEMEYDDAARLNYGACYPEAGDDFSDVERVELCIIRQSASDEGAADNAEWEGTGDAAEAEAMFAASRIKELVAGDGGRGPARVYDRRLGQYRAANYSDIVILLRSTKGWANTFVEVFHRCRIPVFADLGSGYFAATEVETVISLLSVIDNPHQDIPLAGVLRSPMFGFKAAELAAVRASSPGGDFLDCVRAAAEKHDPVAERLRSFLLQLDRWRTLARRKPLPELIWQLYRDTGYYQFVGGLAAGAQRQANLRALHNRAREYEQTSYRGLFRFLRFIERVREKGDDLGTARPLGENENVVRIMSVHRSKGLEFPVVILAGLGRHFNLRDGIGDVLLHKSLGLAADVVDPDLRLRYPTLYKHLVRSRLRSEALAEEMRVLYVALTRARERLILVGSHKQPEKLFASFDWSAPGASPLVSSPDVLSAHSYLEWIVLAVSGHPDFHQCRTSPSWAPPVQANNDLSRWAVRVTSPQELARNCPIRSQAAGDAAIVSRIRAASPVRAAGSETDEVNRRLNWSYRWKPETFRPAKLTATELVRRGEDALGEAALMGPYRPRFIKKPVFMQGETPLAAVERGSALHLVMQHIDLTVWTEDEAQKEIDRMVGSEILTLEQAQAVNPALVARFLQSDLGCRIRSAIGFRREVPFTLRLAAERFYAGVEPGTEFVLVQGVIDGLLTEEDGYVILDYKTDRVPPGGDREVAQRYRTQLELYAEAVELIMGGRVKARYVYLFDTETAIEL